MTVNTPAPGTFPGLTPGTALRGARGRRSMTQAMLSVLLNLPVGRLSDMEHDKKPIPPDLAERLAEVLGVSPQTFL